MTEQEAKFLIENTLQEDFNRTNFIRFISNLLSKPIIEKEKPYYIWVREAFKKNIEKYEKVSDFSDEQGRRIGVLIVYLIEESTYNSRTFQRNFALNYIKDNNKDGVLIAYVIPGKEDWRFSFVKLESEVKRNVQGRVIDVDIYTPAKRASFLVGKKENSHTAKQQFLPLICMEQLPRFEDIEEAFSIEEVTKEFFNKYEKLYDRVEKALTTEIEKDNSLKKEFQEKQITTSDFSKKLLGQIVFLYFLQKKGWFGIAQGKKWGDGPRNFLRELFDARSKYGNNFFNDVLEPLFYNALGHKRDKDQLYKELDNSKIPFLNGGLFEPMRGYSWKTTKLLLPDDLFSNKETEGEEEGDGILDVFDRYNFTVNESDPLEKEIAVDPEMLGKVFESLLDIDDRKGKGAFYTPREIVHYMCQESLIYYLETETKGTIPREDIENLVLNGENIIQNDLIAMERRQKKKKIGGGYYEDQTYPILLPEPIRKNAKKIDDLLKGVKVCDPAVGSGAFPLGMINEIVSARNVLHEICLDEKQTIYKLKKYAIANSIHGVDLESSAVDIARLRLWLSLIVDQEEPSPLPNLEHRIMQGDSLLEEYKGVKLYDDSMLDNVETREKEKDFLKQKLSDLQQEFFKITDGKLKENILKELSTIEKRLKVLRNIGVSGAEGIEMFTERNDFMDSFESLEKKQEEFFVTSDPTQKAELRMDIDNLIWDLIEITLRNSSQEKELDKILKLRESNEKPFFLWRLNFSEVFKEKGGFDIVIGNPPYIQLQKDGGYLADRYQRAGFTTFSRTGDIYALFYEKGNKLLKDSGHLAFITSNKWMRAAYGENLRRYLSENTTPLELIDLGPGVFESATVDTNILIFKKGNSKEEALGCIVKDKSKFKDVKLRDFIKENIVRLKELSGESWIILSPLEMSIKEKIEKMGKRLKNWDININRGILTGYNEAFVIDGQKKKELIEEDPGSGEILKPILRGRDIGRYYSKFANLWLIAAHNGYQKDSGEYIPPININDYPAIKKWLDSHWKEINKRGDKGRTPYNLRNCAYQNEFEKEKIIFQELTQGSQFAYDSEDKYFINNTAYLITGDNLKYLLAFLNSKLVNFVYPKFYCTKIGEQGIRWLYQNIIELPIIEYDMLESEIRERIKENMNRILDLTASSNYNPNKSSQEQKQFEEEIDRIIYKIYDLSPEEIEIIENSTKE